MSRLAEKIIERVTKNELLNAPTKDIKRSNFGMAAARQTVI